MGFPATTGVLGFLSFCTRKRQIDVFRRVVVLIDSVVAGDYGMASPFGKCAAPIEPFTQGRSSR